jgi:PAS domain S-box-containing protein
MVIGVGVAVSFFSFRQIETAADARRQTIVLLHAANELLSELKDAETGQRGYALTGDEAFLAPYLEVQDGLAGRLEALLQITPEPAERLRLQTVAPLLQAKLQHMSAVVALRRSGDMAGALARVRNGEGKRLMDTIRAEMGTFVGQQEAALGQRDAEFRLRMARLFNLIVVASLLTVAMALFFGYLIYRDARQRLQNQLHQETRRLLALQEATNGQLQQANLALSDREEKLAVTLNSIGDAVIATDAQACVTLLNPVAEQLTGWSQAQALGRPVGEVFHILSKQTRQPSAIPVMQTLAHGTVQGLANHTVLMARDGTESDIADSCAPIHDREGQVVGAVLVFRNVTGEYKVQRALRESEERFRGTFENAAIGIAHVGLDGRWLQMNEALCRMTGYTAAELAGMRFADITHPDDLQADLVQMQQVLSGEITTYSMRKRYVCKGGALLWANLTVSLLRDPAGQPLHFISMIEDITEFKRLDQILQDRNTELQGAKIEAEKANLAKSDFLSSMSHELRTPLNAILGFAQLMESGTPAPTPTQRRNLEQILKAGWYLLELINEILDLALIESGKVVLSHEPVSLDCVLPECQTMMEPQAHKRGIGMTFPRLGGVPCFVRADRMRLKQVLINLLSNAIKYNRPGGAVAVDFARPSAQRVRISVRDTGVGLSEAQLAQLFQPFNRLGQEGSTEEGTGIGLVVTRRLVELMGGTLGVHSAMGVGSVFWIELDLTLAPRLEPLQAPQATLPAVVPDGGPQRTVLYVEDNPANLELVAQLLARRADLLLLSAADGRLGIEFARAHQPQLILMDIHLPGISGMEAMKILRADPCTAHIPIIALTANAVPRDIEMGLEAGFFSYLTKPIMVHQFMAALDAALDSAPPRSGPTPQLQKETA